MKSNNFQKHFFQVGLRHIQICILISSNASLGGKNVVFLVIDFGCVGMNQSYWSMKSTVLSEQKVLWQPCENSHCCGGWYS